MKKTVISTFLIAAGAFALLNTATVQAEQYSGPQNTAVVRLGYDKSMSSKTIKAAVIDSYFRQVCKMAKSLDGIKHQCL